MDNVEIKNLSEAKKEYTHQLINLLKSEIYIGIKNIYDTVNFENKNYLEEFQNKLREIPKWNQDIIDKNFETFKKNTNCDWLDELLQAVFISNTAILTTVKSKNHSQSKIDLTIPKCTRFIHKCYIESAREIFKNPYLFLYNLDYKSSQKNMRETLDLISISIENSVRNLLPMREILKQYLTGVEINAEKGTDFHLSDETISQKAPTKDEKIIEKLEKEIENNIKNDNLNLVDTSKVKELKNDVLVVPELHEKVVDEVKTNQNTLLEKNKLLNDDIERLNDINSDSEENNEQNHEELVNYMNNLNKNVGTETEMKAYENETLIDNNLETLNKKNMNIADLSDKNLENYNNIINEEIFNEKENLNEDSENNIQDDVQEKLENENILEQVNLDDNNFQEKLEIKNIIEQINLDDNNDNEKLENENKINFDAVNNTKNEDNILQIIDEEQNNDKEFEYEQLFNNNLKNLNSENNKKLFETTNLNQNNDIEKKDLQLNTNTILPMNTEILNDYDDHSDDAVEVYNEMKMGKYNLNLGNIEMNNTLDEENKILETFNNKELNKEIENMTLELNQLEVLDNNEMEPNKMVINLKKKNSLNNQDVSNSDDNELYQVDLPDDLQ